MRFVLSIIHLEWMRSESIVDMLYSCLPHRVSNWTVFETVSCIHSTCTLTRRSEQEYYQAWEFSGKSRNSCFFGQNLCIFLPFHDVLGLFDKISCFFVKSHSHACIIEIANFVCASRLNSTASQKLTLSMQLVCDVFSESFVFLGNLN